MVLLILFFFHRIFFAFINKSRKGLISKRILLLYLLLYLYLLLLILLLFNRSLKLLLIFNQLRLLLYHLLFYSTLPTIDFFHQFFNLLRYNNGTIKVIHLHSLFLSLLQNRQLFSNWLQILNFLLNQLSALKVLILNSNFFLFL